MVRGAGPKTQPGDARCLPSQRITNNSDTRRRCRPSHPLLGAWFANGELTLFGDLLAEKWQVNSDRKLQTGRSGR